MAQIPRADKGFSCPMWRKPMEQVCHKCPMWQQFRGRDPNTGYLIDQWACGIAMLPRLLMENTKETLDGTVATQQFHNFFSSSVQAASNERIAAQQEAAHARAVETERRRRIANGE